MDPTGIRRRLEAIPPWVADVLVAATTGAGVVYLLSLRLEGGSRAPDTVAYATAFATVALLLGRRRWPVPVLLLVVGVSSLFYGAGYPGGSLQPAVFVAVYSAAAAGRRWWSLLVVLWIVVTSVPYRVGVEGEPLFGPGVLIDTGFLVASWALGVASYHRHRWMEEVRERLRRAEADRDREAQRRVTEERLRIARELHDVLAHTIAVIAVQAGVAADVLDESPGQARKALEEIRAASRAAKDELRATIGVLRSEDRATPPRAPVPGLDQLGALVNTASAAGVEVEVAVHGEVRPLPAAVDLTAYRILQESLTNVVRHSGANSARMSISYGPGIVRLEVDDDGRGPAERDGTGHGLEGMRERAEAVGGWLEAGPAPGKGFRVQASLPTERAYA